jgi:hypothetical protein
MKQIGEPLTFKNPIVKEADTLFNNATGTDAELSQLIRLGERVSGADRRIIGDLTEGFIARFGFPGPPGDAQSPKPWPLLGAMLTHCYP